MDARTKIANVINGRICGVLSKGKSLENLELMIEDLKDKNICWVGQNRIDYIEDSIFAKIHKHIDLISNCATVKYFERYESQRLASWEEYLSRPDNNLLMTLKLVIEFCFMNQKRQDLLEKFQNKIVTIDELFSYSYCPKEVWNKPPNSLTLLLAFLIAGGAKKIILFGLDGCLQTNQKENAAIDTYYKSEIMKAERLLGFGNVALGSVLTDGDAFNKEFPQILEMYKKTYNNLDVEIVNCSSNSLINVFRKINYSQLLQEL